MGRIAAIDYGLKRIGIALSDEKKIIALPFATVEGGKRGAAAVAARLLERRKEIEAIVIGLPLLMNGQKGEMALHIEIFGKELGELLSLPIVFFDERLSSKQADASLRAMGQNRKKRTEHIDQAAAALLLQTYLDQQMRFLI